MRAANCYYRNESRIRLIMVSLGWVGRLLRRKIILAAQTTVITTVRERPRGASPALIAR